MLADLGLTVSASTLDTLDSLSRTLAHLAEYAIFSALLYGSFWRARGCLWQAGLACRSVAVAAAYALTDEFHQAFVSGRHASLVDSALDTLGSALAMGIVYVCWRWSEKKTYQEEMENS